MCFLPLFASAQKETRKDWFNDDGAEEQVVGASIDKTYENLIKGKTPNQIIVAVIDSGVDIEHEDL
ncbi:MAG: cell wall-associated protease, partial [Flavobacteriales bacterium]